MEKQYSIHNLIEMIATQLLSKVETLSAARQEAWWLLEKLFNQSKTHLLISKEISLTEQQNHLLTEWISQRVQQHKPLQYILGTVPFCGLEIHVEPPILIPRPETEEWTAWLIEKIKTFDNKQIRILDLCCGSGCISLALAHNLPQATVIGIDINPQAIALSEKNKLINNINNVIFIQSDLYQNLPLDQSFNLIVSNPPYISKEDYEQLPADVKKWEDRNALLAQDKGLKIYTKIIEKASRYLQSTTVNNLSIVLELGIDQAQSVKTLLEKSSFKNIQIHTDLNGVHRWICASI